MNQLLINKQSQIDGNGLIVEIDEAKFGRQKYNCGRLINGQWLFGSIERTTKKIFVLPVPYRKTEVLLPLIQKYIASGTIISSDCWKAYKQIDKNIYQHYVVNHSQNFVDPDTDDTVLKTSNGYGEIFALLFLDMVAKNIILSIT